MKKQLNFNSITQTLKVSLAILGALVTGDMNTTKSADLSQVEYSIQQPSLDSNVQSVLIDFISRIASLVRDFNNSGLSILFAQAVSSQELEELHDSLDELSLLLEKFDQKFGMEGREVVKKLRKLNTSLQSLYQDIAVYSYKKEADEAILSRVGSKISHSFDETFSRDAIRKALLG